MTVVAGIETLVKFFHLKIIIFVEITAFQNFKNNENFEALPKMIRFKIYRS